MEGSTPAHSASNAPVAPAMQDKAAGGPSSAFADAQGLNCPQDLPRATTYVKEVKPVVHAAPTLTSKLCQAQALLQRHVFHPLAAQTSAQLCTSVDNNRDSPANCADGSQRLPSPAQAHATTSKQIGHPHDSGEAVNKSAPAAGVSGGCSQGQASQGNTIRRALPGHLRGLNGPLLSRSCKRKATPTPLPPLEPQQPASIDLTMSDDDIADIITATTKRIKAEPQEGVHGHTCHADSLALMVQEVNMSLKEKPISKDQLQRLQDAVDSVGELQTLNRQELTDVLTSIGMLESIQKIHVRQYLQRA